MSAIVVLGPHRSGTSLVTRLINLMGAYFGDEADAIEAGIDNPKGFWERRDVVAVNDRILRHFESEWDQLAGWSFDRTAMPLPADLLADLAATVAGLDRHRPWVCKDPRLSVTLPYWLPSVPGAVGVIVSRDPAEVAVSLAERNRVSLGHALAIWEYYSVGILTHARSLPTVRVSYEAMLASPIEAVASLHAALGRAGIELCVPAAADVTAFVDRSLHRSRPDPAEAQAMLTPRHLALHAALAQGGPDANRLWTPSTLASTAMDQYRELVRQRAWSANQTQRADAAEAERDQQAERVGAAQIARAAELAEATQRLGELDAEVRTATTDLWRERTLRLEERQADERARVEREAAVVREHAALTQAVSSLTVERDAALAGLVEVRRTWSWRLTSPFRFVRYVATGNVTKVRYIVANVGERARRVAPRWVREPIERWQARILETAGLLPHSAANFPAIAAIVEARNRSTATPCRVDPLTAPLPADPPAVDISVVTYNSRTWIERFSTSLLALRYPAAKIAVHFVDNTSTDDTQALIETVLPRLREAGMVASLVVRPNRGYGAGHNVGIGNGTAPFCLVTNVDLEFEPDALSRVVATAVADPAGGAWELRQKPYEHPKFYDPVTGETNWTSHACVLLRRAALEAVGTYDESLFMYGEDVEMSYRLRRGGYTLRYCPSAVVFHYSYENPDTVKPRQFTGSTFANLYLRLKYGRRGDMAAVPVMAGRLLVAPEVFPGARRATLQNLLRLAALVPSTLGRRQRSTARFPFRLWDYEMTRDGAFLAVGALSADPPLVSVVTRTYRGRAQFLRQCLLSVAHQSYPNVEHVVVEDGGTTAEAVVAEVAAATGRPARFIGLEKVGRSAAGNRGLEAARGRWCVFLDDDDLLFADHVEVLVGALLRDPEAQAAYALSWEVVTESRPDGYREIVHGVPTIHRQPFDHAVLRHHNFMAIQAVLFERRLFLERGGFDEDVDVLEDWMLWNRYAHRGTFVYVPKVTSLYRTPADPSKVGTRMDAFGAAYPMAVARIEARLKAIDAQVTA